MANPIAFAVLLLLSAFIALTRGGAPERWAALFYLLAYLGTAAFAFINPHPYHGIDVGMFLVDLFLASALLMLALKANRFWTLWVTAMQIVSVISHLVKVIVPDILSLAYAATLIVWSYGMVPILIIGTMRHQQRVNRFGSDVNWSA